MTEALAGSGGLEALVFDGADSLWCDAKPAALVAACLDRLAALLPRSSTALLLPRSPALGRSPALSALGHHATVRLHLKRECWLREHSDIRGYEVCVEVLNNRLGPAGRMATVTIMLEGDV